MRTRGTARRRGTRRSLALASLALLAAAGPAAAAAREEAVESFDGTRLAVSFFPADGLGEGQRAPTVMLGPGWSIPRASDSGSSSPSPLEAQFGAISVRRLRAAGYNVVTWDPRGFGESGGTVQVDSPDAEGRDVQVLLDWVARQPEAELDAPGDARVGMHGASYGGGIQLVAAGLDRRIDAIVPVIAWHSLSTSLYKEQVFKSGWGLILFAAGVPAATAYGMVPGGPAGTQTGHLDPHIYSAFASTATSGRLSDEDARWFASRGPGDLVRRIRVPTLLIQGTVDTLFTLQEAITNYGILRENGVPVRMIWFCGGHGACLTEPGDRERTARATIAWLDRWVKRDASVDTGPRFEGIDQRGEPFAAADYPLAPAGSLVAEGSGVLAIEPGASSGFAIAATAAADAFSLPVPAAGDTVRAVGAPRLELTYRGTAANPDVRVYAQIVDSATGVVLGNQVTPIPLVLDGAEHSVSRPLEVVSAKLPAGGRGLTLQIVPGTNVYDPQRTAGAVTFSRVRVEVPLVDPAATLSSRAGRLRVLAVRGARRGARRLVVVVGVSGSRARSVRASVRSARGRLVGRSAGAPSVARRRRVVVRLRSPLAPGRHVVAVSGRDGDGERVTATRNLSVR